MLDFPSSPTDGQLFPDPAVEGERQWTWSAVQGVWMMVGGVGGGVPEAPQDGTIYGRQDTNWVMAPGFMGVTSGSVAGPGQIGEGINFSGSNPALPVFNAFGNSSLSIPINGTITPGSWLVWLTCYFTATLSAAIPNFQLMVGYCSLAATAFGVNFASPYFHVRPFLVGGGVQYVGGLYCHAVTMAQLNNGAPLVNPSVTFNFQGWSGYPDFTGANFGSYLSGRAIRIR